MSKLCILPWVHMQLDPDGSMLRCCRSWGTPSLGSVKTESVKEIWNGEEIRKLRLEFLAGKLPSGCEDCIRREEWGRSLRQESNERFHDFFGRVDQTRSDGSLPSEIPVSLGLRFSNLCNFKCRSCSAHYSSSFAQERSVVHDTELVPVTHAFENPQQAQTWFSSLIPTLNHLYFAGGEPLLDEQHYHFLEALLAENKTDVSLVYNTNFSTLNLKDWDVLKLWSKFPNVAIFASLDAVGEHAEIIRKGTRWNLIEKNFTKLKEFAPHVEFKVFPTVSVMNAFHLPIAIARWIELGMIRGLGDLSVNVLTGPTHFCLRVFNESERNALTESYQRYLESIATSLSPEFFHHIKEELNRVLASFQEAHEPATRQLFKKATFTFDRIRNERLVSKFPELMGLLYET